MPTIKNGNATVYYEEHGSGFPILTFAPGGLGRSTTKIWSAPSAPINPVTEWSKDYRVIVMDQRNTEGFRSHAPMTAKDGWQQWTSDQVAVLDHLGIKKVHLYGQCIGGPFIMSMLRAQPQRIQSAVLAQPSGRVGPINPEWTANFKEWSKILGERPDANEKVLDAIYHNLYGAGFVYSVDRAFVASCLTPCLLMAGNDDAHPRPVSDEMAKLLPNVEYIPDWKTGAALEAAKPRVKAFLAKNTPR